MADRGEDRERGKRAARPIQNERGMARGEAHIQHPVMNMTAIPLEDGDLAQKAPTDRQTHIGEWKRKGHQRHGQAQSTLRVLGPHQAEAAQQKADGQAAAVAQEYGCRAEVIAQKREQSTRKRSRHQRQAKVPVDHGNAKHGQRGQQAHARSQTIHAIDQVDRVGGADEPRNAQESAQGR